MSVQDAPALPSPRTEPARLPDAPVQAALAVATQAVMLPEGQTSIQDVTSVKLSLSVTGLREDSELVTEFIAPGDILYERRTSAITQSAGGAQTVMLSLPVAGTHVQNFGLSGDWSAEISIAGEHIATQPFGLTP